MAHVGQIKSRSDSRGINLEEWCKLITSHKALARVPPIIGKNPLTGAPMDLKAPGSTALVVANGVDIGAIYWAMDGSPFLLVSSKEGAMKVVEKIARDIATILGANFIREDDC